MFSPSFYDKLDPSYRLLLHELESVLPQIEEDWKKGIESEIFKKFSFNYMTPKELWEKYYNTKKDDLDKKHNIVKHRVYSSVYHFYYKADRFYNLTKLNKIMDKDKARDATDGYVTPEDLFYPHNMLDINFTVFEKEADSTMPPKSVKAFQKMKDLYKKIKSFDGQDDEKWFYAVLETDDFEFVQQNVEFKLGEDLANKKLWHLYINYVKEHNCSYLLQIYARYCRFFLDDEKMKQEYQEAASKFGEVKVSWKNPFDFEVYAEAEWIKYSPDALFKFSTLLSHTSKSKSPPACYFNHQSMASQQLPFLSTLIDYIVKKSNARVLQKLNNSCKYFYHRYRIPVCYKLKISPKFPQTKDVEYCNESVELRRILPFKNHMQRIYVSTVFNFCKNNIYSLSNIIPLMYRCDAKYISIKHQVLTLADFKFLVGNGNVIDLEFSTVTINTSDSPNVKRDTVLKLEEILEANPKLQYLRMKDVPYSSQTAQKLSQLSFVNKFQHFELSSAENILLEPNALAEFVKNNMASNGFIKIEFIFDDDVVRITAITQAIENVLNFNWEENQRPVFKVTQRIFNTH
uniref:Uncharacterized protein n=1 Tax=Panagrolaimus sp. ES5 TaxID=591445 RepID=A0AC34FAT0_9BILA